MARLLRGLLVMPVYQILVDASKNYEDNSICRSNPCPNRCEFWDDYTAPGKSNMRPWFYMCEGLIDYEFFMPMNVTQSTYTWYASSFGYGQEGIHSNTCAASIKRNLCSQLYRRCPSGIDLDDYSTWNYVPVDEGSSIPLPYDRPCRSTCEAISDTCGIAGHVLGNPDCDEVSSVTGVGVYSSNDIECRTSLTNETLVTVAEVIEPYLYSDGGGACSGVIDEVFTPSWDMLYLSRHFMFFGLDFRGSLLLAPFIPPYYTQSLAEVFIEYFWSTQLFYFINFSSKCDMAHRKFFCGITFQSGQSQTHLATYLPDLILPQRPSRKICEDYVNECQSNSYQGTSVDSFNLGYKYDLTAREAFHHCSCAVNIYNFNVSIQEESYSNMSWYASKSETVLQLPIGDVLRSPNNMTTALAVPFFEEPLCHLLNGINHPPVLATNLNSKTLWADSASGMMDRWYTFVVNAGSSKFKTSQWDSAICSKGWSESNPDCPWSFQKHHEAAGCFKSCYQWSNMLTSMRDPDLNEQINKIDQVVLWVVLVLMTYMVVTWTIFKEKAKQRVVLVLSILMWMQTVIELLGYIIYPKSDDRFCENDAVPRHNGFNYCAVSAMLNLGLISPMFQMMIACMAIDVYFKVIMNLKNKNHYWKYYTAASFGVSFFFKFVPVFLYIGAAGFDGVNSCSYTFYIRQPLGIGTPTPVEYLNPKFRLSLAQQLLINSVEHLAWIISVVLFTRIIFAVLSSLKRVGSSESSESSLANAFKQARLVKTPVMMIFVFTIVSAVNMYLWDVYAIENYQYFGPAKTPMNKSWNDAALGSTFYQYLLPKPELAFQKWEFVSRIQKIINFWYKVINHAAFPLLVFFVFGTHKDNVKLWAKKFQVEDYLKSSESMAGGSSYAWTIANENQKLQKFGISKYFSQLFSDTKTNLEPIRESGVESTWEGNTASVADRGNL